ncbi:MAG: phosphatidylinositol-specific phospholipase C domain-containing protein, partial [Moraxellaceae bacterium]
MGFNVWKCRGTYGIGILRSTDGGANWTQVLTKTSNELFAIQEIMYNPANANEVFACATDGLYKSTDGGATWSATPFYAKTYVRDIAINPSNAQQMVISVGNLANTDKGLYRTTDGGTTWGKIAGLPTGMTGYTKLDNNGTRLYAAFGIAGTAKTQELTVLEQLEAGVRFLDIRVCGSDFAIWHGPVRQQLRFYQILDDVRTFLQNNPSEAVIMSVKGESSEISFIRPCTISDSEVHAQLMTFVNQEPNLWNVGVQIPNLLAGRGKITLFRRFDVSRLPAIGIPDWDKGSVVSAQDKYSLEPHEFDLKWSLIRELTVRAQSDQTDELYV